MTSHDMDDIEKVCDRVIVINHGKLIYDDSLEELKKKHSQEKYIRIIFSNSVPLIKEGNFTVVEKGNAYLLLKSIQSLIPSIINSFENESIIDDIDIYSEPLEEMIKMILN